MSGLPPPPPPDPEHVADAGAGASGAAPQPSADHHGLIVFVGVLALVLLLVGAVGAAGLSGSSGSGGAGPVGAPGQGNAYGQQKQAQKAERKAQREAEKRHRKQDQLERKAQREELKEQRRGSGPMGPKVAEGAEVLSEQTGTVATQTAVDGTTVYVLQTAAGTLVLDVGPPRYWGESHPLATFVGQTVTVSGVQKAGAGEFAVYAIGDQIIRGPGRPPWAGGWKVDVMEVPTTGASPSPTPSPAP